MDGHADSLNATLPGMLVAVAIVAIVLTLLVSPLLLRWYRRAIVRGMSQVARTERTPVAEPQSRTPARPLAFHELAFGAAGAGALPGSSPWRVAGIYAVAVLVLASIMALASTWDAFREPGGSGAPWVAWVSYVVMHAWPAVLVVNLVAPTDRATVLRVAGAYFLLWLLVCAWLLARNPQLPAWGLVRSWLAANGLPTLLVWIVLLRRIRAVAPMVLAFSFLVVLGAQGLLFLVGASERSMRVAVQAGGLLGLGGAGAFWATALVGALLLGVGGWFALKWVGRRYAAKRYSAEMMTLDAAVLVFACADSIGLVFTHWALGLVGLLGYLAYRGTAALLLRRLPRVQSPHQLLLLRVFALGARSERLFEAVRRRWLRGGSVAMIAGPDLVTSEIEPHEFLAFLSRQLTRSFVSGADDLDARLAAMDRRPDPDGRFRVTEFFCRDDTWQMTMERLVAESDAVLMDLRSFGPGNQGCLYELGRLLDAIELDRIVFVIDATTDRAFLEQALTRLWARLAADSPNQNAAAPAVRLMRVGAPTAAESRVLVGHLAAS